MTVIVCQDCDEVIEFVEAEKVDVLWARCPECRSRLRAESNSVEA